MKAVVCKELGLPEKLVVEDVPSPKLGAGDVRIKVAGADVNFPDVLIIQGKYQLKAQPPLVPGAGVTGTVLEVGEKVKHIKAGDAVAALINVGGGYTWRGIRLGVDVSNLFDTAYDLPLGGLSLGDYGATGVLRPVPGRGRSVNVELSAAF